MFVIDTAYIETFASTFAEQCTHLCDLNDEVPSSGETIAVELAAPLLVRLGSGGTELKYLARPRESGIELLVVAGATLLDGYYFVRRDGAIAYASQDDQTPTAEELQARLEPLLFALARRSSWESVVA